MKKLIRLCCCLAVAAAVFGASAEVLWEWDGSKKLTEILSEGSTGTAWELNLTADGGLSFVKEGTNPVLDLRVETMPAGVPEIKSFARFGNGAANCTTVYLPSSLTTLNAYAFFNWKKLTSVNLGQTSVTEIPDYCFFLCSALPRVALPTAVTKIGMSAFNGCTSLEAIELPEVLTYLGGSAFVGCQSLKHVTPCVPKGVTYLGSSVFDGCKNLAEEFSVGYATDETGAVLETVLDGGKQLLNAESVLSIRIGPGVKSALPSYFYTNVKPCFVEFGESIDAVPEIFAGARLTNAVFRSTKTVSVCSKAFYGQVGLREITWGGWFSYTPGTYTFLNWADKTCRFIVPWHNDDCNAFLADAGNMEKLWADFTSEEKAAYFTRYGADEPWPVGLTKSQGQHNLPQVYIVRDQNATDADGYQLLAKTSNPEMSTVSVDKDPSEMTGLYARDTEVTVTVAVQPGATFLGWEGDVPEDDRMKTTLTLTMNMRRKLTAVVSIQPEIVPGSFTVSFPNGDSQPRVNFSLTGEEEAAYDATAVIWWKTNGTDWVACRTKSGLRNGEDASIWLPVAFIAGSTLDVRVTVSADNAATRTAEQTGIAVTNPLPQSYGKGGGANVYHVRPGATGDGSGRDWFHAAESLPTDLAQIPTEKSEAWFAGNGGLSGEVYSFAERNFTLRGGVTGFECSAAERGPSARTLIDRCDTVDYGLQLPDYFSTDLTIDGFEFARAKMRGVNQTGSLGKTDGRLEIVNCAFVSNGLATAFGWTEGGRALKLYGITKDKWGDFVCSNCVFRGNVAVHGDGNKCGGKAPILVYTMRSVAFIDCTFVGNGIDWSREICAETDIKQLSDKLWFKQGGIFISLRPRC